MKITKEQKQQYVEYFLGCIDTGDCDTEITTEKEKIEYVTLCFRGEIWHWRKKQEIISPNTAIIEWLQGLPSCLRMAYTYHDIDTLAEKILKRKLSEKQLFIAERDYWPLMAEIFMRLIRRHHLMDMIYY